MNRIFFVISTLVFFYSCEKKRIDSYCCSNPPTQIEFDGGYLTIPNIFTPDGDGFYDFFSVQSQGIANFELSIKNNWGISVYSSNDPSNIWDGKKNNKLKQGIYTYKVNAKSTNGFVIEAKGCICIISNYEGNCIENSSSCVFKSEWNGSSFIEAPMIDEYKQCP